MIPMIKINLLPYREERLQRQKQNFKYMMMASALAGLIIAVIGYMLLAGWSSYQEGRNQSLKDGIAMLDVRLKEIQRLEVEKKSFNERKHKVEELDSMRFQAARIIDTLNQMVPDGLYLTSISGKGDTYTLTGQAVSDSLVSTFMTSFQDHQDLFTTPALDSIKSVGDAQEFNITVDAIPPSKPADTNH